MTFKLPTLPPVQPQWGQFQVWWQQVKTAIENQETVQDTLLTQIVAAQAAATAAQTTATAVNKQDKIASSFTVPAAVLTAAAAGASATITIAAHTRLYNDGTQLAVAGGTITGRAFSTYYAVYYDDSTLSVTTPNYVSTTTAAQGQPNFAPGRHRIGAVTTPASGGAATTGGGVPSGSPSSDIDKFSTL